LILLLKINDFAGFLKAVFGKVFGHRNSSRLCGLCALHHIKLVFAFARSRRFLKGQILIVTRSSVRIIGVSLPLNGGGREDFMIINCLSLLLFLLIPCSNSFAQQISHDELIEILGIKSWRVPMPKDESMEWGIEVVDYVPRKYTNMNTKRLNLRKKALIVFRDMGKDIYQFTLKQTRGTGQGDLEINICSEKARNENRCDNSYTLAWHDVPKPFGDGTKFVIADIAPMLDPDKPRKQIILEPSHFRLEDIMKERPSVP